MTGYARTVRTLAEAIPEGIGTTASAGARIALEIRSVNSRFLDLSFRLSEELRAGEPAMREVVQSKIRRGKIEVRGALETIGPEDTTAVDGAGLVRLGEAQARVRAVLPDAAPLSVADVLRLGAGRVASPRDLSNDLAMAARDAIALLLESRAREGGRLAATLLSQVVQLRMLASRAAPLVPQLAALQRSRFLERWRLALEDARTADGNAGMPLPESAQDRALSEATAYAMRIDVAEELTRLTAHLDEIERLLGQGAGETGRRLDFLIQELHREANTLGSKSAALETTRIAVDMKVLIEQMREQVQNIE